MRDDREANKKVAETYFACLSAGDLDGAAAQFADDLDWVVTGHTEYAGSFTKEELMEVLRGLYTALAAPMQIWATAMTAEGDRVAVQAESRASLTNGKVYQNQYHLLIEVRDGKIRRGFEYFDTLAMSRVLDDIIPPAQGGNGDAPSPVETTTERAEPDTSWQGIVQSLAEAGGAVQAAAAAWGAGELFSQEVSKQLLGALAQGYFGLVYTDPDHPEFVPMLNMAINHAAPNADYNYMYAPLRGQGVYRLSGCRGTTKFVQLSTGAVGYMHADTPGPSLATYDLDDLPLAADGTFEVILSSERPAGYSGEWWYLHPEATYMSYRQASYDWAAEIDASVAIDRCDVPAQPSPLSAAELSRRMAGLGEWMRRAVERWFAHMADIERRGVVNRVQVYDYGTIGGLKGQVYIEGMYRLAADEALILETEIPDTVRYWSFLVTDDVFATIDYHNRQASLNGHQAQIDSDGKFRAVISATDPGIANWLDTAGYAKGVIQGRWERASSAPAPVVTLVKLDQLWQHLPADTPRIDAQQRDQQLRARRRGAQLRRRW